MDYHFPLTEHLWDTFDLVITSHRHQGMRTYRNKCDSLITHTYFRSQPDPIVLIYTGSILVSYILLDFIESHVIMPIIQNTETEE